MTAATVGPYEHTGAYRPDVMAQTDQPADCGTPESTVPLVDEPAGLWAVVKHLSPEYPDEPYYLVKGPGCFGGPYWYRLGGEDGWSWDQVSSWQGRIFLVRGGIES